MIQNINGVNVFVEDETPTEGVNTIIETVNTTPAEPATQTADAGDDKKLSIDPKNVCLL